MKKLFISVIFVIIIILVSPFSIASSKAIVNIEAVRMRKGKSTDSEILTIVYEDDECELLDDDGEWCKIKYGEYTGYAKSEFFTIKKDTTITAKNTVNNTTNNISTDNVQNVENTNIEIVVTATYTIENNVYIKNLPNFVSVNKAEITSGTVVKVESNMNNWYKISCDEKSGWINKNDLKIAVSEKNVENEEIEKSTDSEPKVEKEDEKKAEEKNDEKTTKTDSTIASQSTGTTKTGIINVDTARVREKASTSSEVIGTLDKNEEITIIAEDGDFYKFKTSTIEGYVSKTLVDIKDITSRSSTESRENLIETNVINDDIATEEVNNIVNDALNNKENASVTGADVVEFAKKYLGYSYVSGGKNPETGFDCSGFTKYVFSNFGVELGATTSDQLTRGTEVARENMQIGDIILFYNDAQTQVGHVGIYMGNGEFIHSANPKRGVVTDNLNTNTYYNTRYICTRRLL